MAIQTRMTASEFLALPESNLPTELIIGEVFMSPAPALNRQDDANIAQLNVLWVAPGSTCVPFEGRYLRGAPDLVVEVLSPGTARRDKKIRNR
jgi:Uma2 family endonuclease